MQTPRDAELLALARRTNLPAWLPVDLFEGRPVPNWVPSSLERLVGTGRLVRETAGACRWKYRVADEAADPGV